MRGIDSEPGFLLDGLAANTPAGSALYTTLFKRSFDLALALLIIPLVLPTIAFLWLLTRIQGGPGLYGHTRIGRNGRPFTCWKIRTMQPDADARLAAHLAADTAAAAEWASDHKLRHDPRITPLGRILRMTSLDELPQLWNVLAGQMSFVGPRPVTAAEIDRYGSQVRFYLTCRPGLTGLWQVSGRNEVRYEDRIAMDRAYAEKISFGSDLTLILRTIPVVLRRTGS